MDDSIQTSSSASGSATEISTSSDRCMNSGWPVRDIGAVVVSVLGLVFVVRYILLKSRRMFVAVGRMEIGVLYMIYIFILLLQIFTIGGVVSRNRTFMVWTSALHLGALVCFFWTLIITALVQYVAMALVTFASSQMILFGASFKIAVGTHGWISGSMFALLLDLVSVGLVYKFWNTITDDTWGDEEF
ncbi:hypothetical protein BGX23_010373 [Mortierella sp. AD031]|nr:hypothetical protein BGX23_010373 [Mortierella sp. AD031]